MACAHTDTLSIPFFGQYVTLSSIQDLQNITQKTFNWVALWKWVKTNDSIQNKLYWISLILRGKHETFNSAESFFFSCNQESSGGGAIHSRVLISSTLSRFTLHCEAITNLATGSEKFFNNLPWQVFPVAQLRNLMCFSEGNRYSLMSGQEWMWAELKNQVR